MSRVNVESREAEVVKEGEYSADDLKSDVSTSARVTGWEQMGPDWLQML